MIVEVIHFCFCARAFCSERMLFSDFIEKEYDSQSFFKESLLEAFKEDTTVDSFQNDFNNAFPSYGAANAVAKYGENRWWAGCTKDADCAWGVWPTGGPRGPTPTLQPCCSDLIGVLM